MAVHITHVSRKLPIPIILKLILNPYNVSSSNSRKGSSKYFGKGKKWRGNTKGQGSGNKFTRKRTASDGSKNKGPFKHSVVREANSSKMLRSSSSLLGKIALNYYSK